MKANSFDNTFLMKTFKSLLMKKNLLKTFLNLPQGNNLT